MKGPSEKISDALIQGICAAVGVLARFPALGDGKKVLKELGISRDDIKSSNVDPFDKKPILKLLKRTGQK